MNLSLTFIDFHWLSLRFSIWESSMIIEPIMIGSLQSFEQTTGGLDSIQAFRCRRIFNDDVDEFPLTMLHRSLQLEASSLLEFESEDSELFRATPLVFQRRQNSLRNGVKRFNFTEELPMWPKDDFSATRKCTSDKLCRAIQLMADHSFTFWRCSEWLELKNLKFNLSSSKFELQIKRR